MLRAKMETVFGPNTGQTGGIECVEPEMPGRHPEDRFLPTSCAMSAASEECAVAVSNARFGWMQMTETNVNVTAIPFNRLLGLRADGATLTLPADPNYHNHLGTVHAAAQFALAEAASGQWLLSRFGAEAARYLAVVRRADVKFRRPAVGALTTQADVAPNEAERFLDALSRRGRASIEVHVRLLDTEGNVTLESSFEWFAHSTQLSV
jgi:acyl-coenzyme A thioesterase PaaI-like protein